MWKCVNLGLLHMYTAESVSALCVEAGRSLSEPTMYQSASLASQLAMETPQPPPSGCWSYSWATTAHLAHGSWEISILILKFVQVLYAEPSPQLL